MNKGYWVYTKSGNLLRFSNAFFHKIEGFFTFYDNDDERFVGQVSIDDVSAIVVIESEEE